MKQQKDFPIGATVRYTGANFKIGAHHKNGLFILLRNYSHGWLWKERELNAIANAALDLSPYEQCWWVNFDTVKLVSTMNEIQAEAKLRFPIGCVFTAVNGSDPVVLMLDDATYRINNNNIWAHNGAGCLYKDGEWAIRHDVDASKSSPITDGFDVKESLSTNPNHVHCDHYTTALGIALCTPPIVI